MLLLCIKVHDIRGVDPSQAARDHRLQYFSIRTHAVGIIITLSITTVRMSFKIIKGLRRWISNQDIAARIVCNMDI